VSSYWDRERLLRSTILAGFAAAGLTVAPSFAQQADEDDEDEEQAEQSGDNIVVTGSRIRRDSFSSTSPLQVIDAETVTEAGLVDTAEIIRSVPVIQGAQLDATINNSFVTNGGPGVNNVSLRGLSADRTLILINGRRMSPAGVEGAPSFPDLNLIPSSIIQRVDILLDGASSVYGSDAVAGVVNVITQQDYEGLNIEGYVSIPEEGGGENQRYSILVGDRSERGGFTFAMEYYDQQNLRILDRDYNRSPSGFYCSQDIDLDASGNQITSAATRPNTCGGSIINRVRVYSFLARPGGGLLLGTDVYRTPGRDGVALNNVAAGGDARSPGDWFVAWAGAGSTAAQNATARTYMSNLPENQSYVANQFTDMLPANTRYNMFFTGDYDIDSLFGLEGTSFFFEASHSNSQTFNDSNYHGQLFPTVPDTNPTNPFTYNNGASFFGYGVVPIIASPVQRSDVDVEIQQTRLLTGLRGDLGFIGAPGWDFEAFASYTRSMGYSSRGAVLEERLRLSLGTTRFDGGGNLVCGDQAYQDLFGFLDPENCVPVNMFAPSLYIYNPETGPQWGTTAERDFLTGERTVTTKVDELVAGAFVTGPLFNLPDGEVSGVFGWEFREIGLDSGVDTIARLGLAAGFFADQLSVGSVNLNEAYAELSFPLLRGRTFAEDLTFDVAARLTDHEFYGQNSTWAAKLSWSPVDYLTFRGTAGTSFRAPNVRELFLGGQTGFTGGGADPCVVPFAATQSGNYVRTDDPRSDTVLNNCIADGVDPTTLGQNGVPSIQSFRAGNPGLDPETSDSISVGFAIDQPWFDAFDFQFGVNYYEINIEDSIAIPGTAFSLNRCYNSTNYPNDPFCARRQRDPNTGFLSFVDNTPFNIAQQTSQGVDYNARFGMDIWGGTRLEASTVWTQSLEITNQTTPGSAVNDFVGTIGFPEWRGTTDARIIAGDWTFFWRGRYIGEQNNLGIFGAAEPACEFGATCVDVLDDVDSVLYHDVSVNWRSDTWRVTVGVNNALNEDPPLVDQNTADATLSGTNVPLGAGYDLIGRRFFVNVAKRF
jgi:iron complex outermembrane receptor protein